MTKMEALANYLLVDVEEIEGGYDSDVFDIENQEYLVLTDEEADERAADYIKDTLWAFNPNFIIDHSSALDHDDGSYKLLEAVYNMFEDGNIAIEKIIDDLDEFIDDAINADGRGHFIATYDGEEGEEGDYYIYRTN